MTLTPTRVPAIPVDTPPAPERGRSADQVCTRCHRAGAAKVTISIGDRRWRYCGWCASRADKTTTLQPVVCEHPYLRAVHQPGHPTGWGCIDCFEPRPAPPDGGCDAPDCTACAQAGHAGLSLIIPVALMGSLLVALAVASGNGRMLIERLPLPEPGLNGYPLLVLLVVGGGCWWRIARTQPRAPEPLEEVPPAPGDFDDPGVLPWFGTLPADLDPDEARPTLLPIHPPQPGRHRQRRS